MRECTCVSVCTHLDAYVCAGHLGAVLLGLICGMYWECRCWIPGTTCLEDLSAFMFVFLSVHRKQSIDHSHAGQTLLLRQILVA